MISANDLLTVVFFALFGFCMYRLGHSRGEIKALSWAAKQLDRIMEANGLDSKDSNTTVTEGSYVKRKTAQKDQAVR